MKCGQMWVSRSCGGWRFTSAPNLNVILFRSLMPLCSCKAQKPNVFLLWLIKDAWFYLKKWTKPFENPGILKEKKKQVDLRRFLSVKQIFCELLHETCCCFFVDEYICSTSLLFDGHICNYPTREKYSKNEEITSDLMQCLCDFLIQPGFSSRSSHLLTFMHLFFSILTKK